MAAKELSFDQEEFLSWSFAQLTHSTTALAYLKSRKVSLRQVQKYEIGFIPAFITCLISGLEDPLYGNCLTFPMRNEYGDLVGITVRSIGNGKRYHKVMYDKTSLPSKRFVYGLAQCLDKVYQYGALLIVEGIFDLMAVEPYFPNVIAMLTSQLSNEQSQLLRRYADRLLFLPDNDRAGREGGQAATKYLSKHFSINVLPCKSSDPSDWRQQNQDEFKSFFKNANETFLI